MTASDPTHRTLHNLLRCIHTGTVERTRLPNQRGWRIDINNQKVPAERRDEIRLALSILETRGLFTWLPLNDDTDYAGRTPRGRLELKHWDHDAVFCEQRTGGVLDLDALNDAVWDDPDGGEAA